MNLPQLQKHAFTTSHSGIVRCLYSEVLVFPGFDPRKVSEEELQSYSCGKFRALWDTGATASVITAKVVKALGIEPVGQVQVSTPNGRSIQDKYFVNFRLPNGVGMAGMTVTCGAMESCDVLLGMDVITTGDFAVTNIEGKTVFSFQTPSTHRIDFVKETKTKKNSDTVKLAPSIGRNSKCPCGSGKKYKQCCGRSA